MSPACCDINFDAISIRNSSFANVACVIAHTDLRSIRRHEVGVEEFSQAPDATLGEVSASGGSSILDSKLMPLLLRLRFHRALPNIDTNLCNIKL